MVETKPRLFSADEYVRMCETGIIGEDEHVELIDGLILEMAPRSNHHRAAVIGLSRFFNIRLAERGLVQTHMSFRLSDLSVPVPDILLLQFRDDMYATKTPTVED